MRTKTIIGLCVYLIILGLLCWVAISGMQIGVMNVLPLGQAMKKGLDLSGGLSIVYEAVNPNEENFNTKMDGAMAVQRTRMDQLGYTEATIARQGAAQIRIEIPTVDEADRENVLKSIGTPAKLEFFEPDGTLVMDGSDIESANAAYYEGNEPVVQFSLTSSGADKFADATRRLIGQIITIKLDGEQISAPRVENAITDGRGIINGMSDIEEARRLAGFIQSGALPLEMTRVEVRDISATLGAEALDYGLLAGIIGIALVMLFMIVIYRLPGFAACIALVTYIYLDFLIIALTGVQLTLPGIAGIILSIGMAVDANVIIFERFKEEYRRGKTLRAACNAGFARAMSTILDSNITTIIAAVVLWIFGTGSIQGFAITLFIGILLSMFTAVVITRFLLNCMIRLDVNNPALYCPGKKKTAGEAQA